MLEVVELLWWVVQYCIYVYFMMLCRYFGDCLIIHYFCPLV